MNSNPYESPELPQSSLQRPWLRLWVAGVLLPPVAVGVDMLMLLARVMQIPRPRVRLPVSFWAVVFGAGMLLVFLGSNESDRRIPRRMAMGVLGLAVMLGVCWVILYLGMVAIEHYDALG